jgi:hypothetical protein
MAYVTQWRSKKPYIVPVRPHPVCKITVCWSFPMGQHSAPIRFDDDGDPVFTLPLAELRNHVTLREQHAGEMDFRLLADGGLEIDLASVVIAH